ncbi:ribonuclease HII [Cellulophaga baltica]|uniref:ribonuclease HII n=1 Tax=Cellulophaga TaxID=104264 RepID=UPI001C07E43D|nr:MULTISPECIES: ribonuclease HII [Cellulophaga]MBU2995336.1 ribonuclease HII [Cellulophaga baltica]MDO6766731.1 ribonuclease HII [Cellulophaga sp. 1_MG-2023]
MRIKILILIVAFNFSCKKEIVTQNSILVDVPQNASAIIKVNDFDVFKSDLKNNSFLKVFEKTKFFSTNTKSLEPLDYIKPEGESILSFVEIGKESFDFFYKTDSNINLIDIDNHKNKTIEEVIYENKSYKKITLDDQVVYTHTKGSSFFASSSQLLIENLIRTTETPETNKTLLKLYNTASKNSNTVVFINTKYSNGLLTANLKNNIKFSDFSDWVSLDAIVTQSEFKLTGISISGNNSPQKFSSLFANVSPFENTVQNYAPINSKAVLSFTFENFENYYNNQQRYLENLPKKDTIFTTTQELGISYINNSKTATLQTYDAENIVKYISLFSNNNTNYQGNEILKLTKKDILSPFESILKNFESNYATILENAIVFSEDIETIQNTISNYKNEATFNKSETYLSAKNSIADASNLLFIASPDGINMLKEEELKEDVNKNLTKLDTKDQILIAQLVSDQNFNHTSLILKNKISKTTTNITAPLYTIHLDDEIVSQPQFAINHLTKKKEIVVQDEKNILYLISTEGKVLWKKELNGRIKGTIEQVDLYKNGRLQLAFITDNHFYILDRNGKDVPTFDMDFEGEILNSLSIFDYDKNRNYRFVISQGTKLHMYDNSGKIVSGFKYKANQNKIINAPKHFRIKTKDYLVFTQDNDVLRIIDRIGSDRIKVKDKINFSQNDIYLYKNKFTTTDANGFLTQVDEKGTAVKTNLNLNKDHGLYTTSNTLVTMNDNTLTIKGKKTELELGVYTKPVIFFIYNKIYVSVTDIQNHKIYLFDSNSKPIQNFPIYGTSLIDLADIDNDKKLELVTKDLDNSLIVYKIN